MENLRRTQKAATRQAIIGAAAAQFAERGYEATSFGSIAAVLGKPKSAVGYHHFPSKLDLAYAVVREQRDRWFLLIRVVSEEPAGFPRLFRLLLSAALDARDNPIAAGAIRLLTEAAQLGLTLPVRQTEWRPYVAEQIQVEIDAHVLPAGTDAAKLTSWLLNASFGVFEAENRGLQEVDTERSLRGLWVVLLTGCGVAHAQQLIDDVARFRFAATYVDPVIERSTVPHAAAVEGTAGA
jgi:AcrR family transcriptional regulator